MEVKLKVWRTIRLQEISYLKAQTGLEIQEKKKNNNSQISLKHSP